MEVEQVKQFVKKHWWYGEVQVCDNINYIVIVVHPKHEQLMQTLYVKWKDEQKWTLPFKIIGLDANDIR